MEYPHFYCQLDYEHIPFPSPTSPKGNLANNGCGPISASMIIENMLKIDFPPEESAKLAKACGAREGFGTNFYIFQEGLIERFGLTITNTEDYDEMLDFLKQKKGMVVANTYGDREDYVGVFSDGGHYVAVIGMEGEEVMVLDPMYKQGSDRFEKPGRKEKVRLSGNVAYANPLVLKDDCRERPFFLFYWPEEK